MSAMPITCPNCRQPFSANIEQIIDVGFDPQLKSRFLSGRLNVAQCPNCGFQAALATPLVYHDADKQLLITYVPMELALPSQEQERVVGGLTNAVISSLPQEKRKGYIFTPKQAFTQQGMVDMILEADGITKEVIESQREKMKLVETFLSATPDTLPDLVKKYDDQIDAEFFALMLAAAETGLAQGHEDIAQAVIAIREQLIQQSSFGQKALASQAQQEALIEDVARELTAMGQHGSRDDMLDLLIKFARESDEKLQVAVGLARAAMDYQFFQQLTKRIEKAKGDQKSELESIRKRLLELTEMVDQQNEAVIRRATDTLRGLLSASDLDEAIDSRLELLDDTFLSVLQANIQNAEQTRDITSAAKFKMIFEKVVAALQASAPPAIRFINDVMSMPNLDASKTAIREHAAEYGPELLQWTDVLLEDLSSQGGSEALDKLGVLRDEMEKVLANAPAAPGNTGFEDAAPGVPFSPRILTKNDPTPPEPPPGKPIIELPSFRRGPRRER